MKQHLEQAKSNEAFLELVEKHSNGAFVDWKITVIFYIALHYAKAYTKFRKQNSGNSHNDLENCLISKCKVPDEISDNYKILYENSRMYRYQVYFKTDFQVLLTSLKYKESKEKLQFLKKFFLSEIKNNS